VRGLRGLLLAGVALLIVAGPEIARAQNDPLQAGDIVRVTLSRMPDMSGDYPVDETGHVALPVIGLVRVDDRPSDEVKREMVAQFEDQLRNQAIQVIFTRRVSVLGAVKNPGLYHVEPSMTLADAVALAGGHAPQGNPEKVKVLKDGREIEVDITEQAIESVSSGSKIVVPERSWVARNVNLLVGAGISTVVVIVRLVD